MQNKSKSVLIVEDQVFFQNVLEKSLVSILPVENDVKKVSSGNQAIEVLKNEGDSIGLILLDMKMDDGDGITVLNFIESHSLYHIPVFIVSSLDKEFINFVIRSISEVEIRLVGFIPKDSPNIVIERITSLAPEILALLREEYKDRDDVLTTPQFSLDSDLFMASLDESLILYVQPKINLSTSSISGYEVLSRLYYEDFGIVEPDTFMSYLDTLDKKNEFHWLLMNKVFLLQKTYLRTGFYCEMSVNVDPEVLSQSDFVDRLEAASQSHQVDLDFLTLEITELAKTEVKNLHFNVARLKLLGVKISLDDFGKGCSNLDRIDEIPFDEIKIDLNLTHKAVSSDSDRQLLHSFVDYIKEKGCRIVAEGIEDKEINDVVLMTGISEGQGYYFGMPIPVDDINSVFIRSFKGRVSLLLGDVSPESFVEIYTYFYKGTIEIIDKHIDRIDNKCTSEFVHLVKGTLKTAGLHEAIVFVEKYSKNESKDDLYRLKNFLAYFMSTVVNN